MLALSLYPVTSEGLDRVLKALEDIPERFKDSPDLVVELILVATYSWYDCCLQSLKSLGRGSFLSFLLMLQHKCLEVRSKLSRPAGSYRTATANGFRQRPR